MTQLNIEGINHNHWAHPTKRATILNNILTHGIMRTEGCNSEWMLAPNGDIALYPEGVARNLSVRYTFAAGNRDVHYIETRYCY
jgi:hypothetical protein